ncbi:hypothetical protein, conserved [Leishmania tarentolae]|uniref:Hd phosphohydrolase family protein n=1 Tax=Leishmania tarentolae TaxID=5689 RepID=A0A640KK92_LEITA|nr:hypothetical protein, conserved [Leishmania tarentolae]
MSAEQLTNEQTPLVRRAWERCVGCLLPLSLTSTSKPSSDSLRAVSERHFRRFIYDRYTESQRHYHTLEHLEEMLAQLVAYETEHGWQGAYIPAMVEETVAASVPPPELLTGPERVAYEWTGTVLLLSVLFHDVVYDPTRGDNEEASAAVAAEFLQTMQREGSDTSNFTSTPLTAAAASLSVADPSALPSASGTTGAEGDVNQKYPPSFSSTPKLLWSDAQAIEFVRNSTTTYILKTKEHLSVEPKQCLHLPASPASSTSVEREMSSVMQQSRDDPLHVFLDLDLSILGHPDADTYRYRYADNIQREYSHYPRADFLKGRIGFLNGFAQHPQWYKTPYFFYRLEARARHNVAQEVKALTIELADVQLAS